jgi:molybdenum cofactor cytidylyltransferase
MDKTIPITAVVLAAGKSSRMGRCKPLLPINGTPMLEVTLQKLLAFPFEQIVCITGHLNQTIQDAIQIDDSRFTWIYNPNYAVGQSTSLQTAAESCSNSTQGILVFLADQPFIQPDTISQILSEVRSMETLGSKCVIQPAFQGQKGHPVFFSRTMLAHFPELKDDVGAKPIIKYAEKHMVIPVEDEGVLIDLDTLEDYDKHHQPK